MKGKTEIGENNHEGYLLKRILLAEKLENLCRICGTFAVLSQKRKKKFNFKIGQLLIKPKVKLIKTPWLLETEYLPNPKIEFEIFYFAARKYHYRAKVTARKMLEFLMTYQLWGEFIRQAAIYLDYLEKTTSPAKIDKFQ